MMGVLQCQRSRPQRDLISSGRNLLRIQSTRNRSIRPTGFTGTRGFWLTCLIPVTAMSRGQLEVFSRGDMQKRKKAVRHWVVFGHRPRRKPCCGGGGVEGILAGYV